MSKNFVNSSSLLPEFIADRRKSRLNRSVIQPTWMTTSFDDNVWSLSSDSRPVIIRFSFEFPDKTNLLDPSNRHLLQTLKELLWEIRQGPQAHITSPLVLSAISTRVIVLFEWMKLNSIQKLSQITGEDFDFYCDEARFGTCNLLDLENPRF